MLKLNVFTRKIQKLQMQMSPVKSRNPRFLSFSESAIAGLTDAEWKQRLEKEVRMFASPRLCQRNSNALLLQLDLPYMRQCFQKIDSDNLRVCEQFALLLNFSFAFQHAIIYPPVNLVFNAFNLSSFNDIRVVIIGQDPYHNPQQV